MHQICKLHKFYSHISTHRADRFECSYDPILSFLLYFMTFQNLSLINTQLQRDVDKSQKQHFRPTFLNGNHILLTHSVVLTDMIISLLILYFYDFSRISYKFSRFEKSHKPVVWRFREKSLILPKLEISRN